MSPTIGLPPPDAERCLDTSRKSRYKGGTLIADDVRELDEHHRRLADPDRYRPPLCAKCGHARLHVHSRPERHPRGDPRLPRAVSILQFRCANTVCGATWRILPVFLARHLWHTWPAVEHSVRTPSVMVRPAPSPIAVRTRERWLARLSASARVLVAVLATSVGVVLEELAKCVGLSGTRGMLVDAYIGIAAPPPSEQLSSLAALVHRLEPGLRLM